MTTTITGATGINNIQAATGAVLQVVHVNYGTGTVSTSDTMVDTGITAAITPISASSKILVTIHASDPFKSATGTTGAINMRIVRGSTQIHAFAFANLFTGTAMQNNGVPMSATYLDSPSTTSATTYKVQFKRYTAAGQIGINVSSGVSTITLQEIAG